jgi:hypothetical protein
MSTPGKSPGLTAIICLASDAYDPMRFLPSTSGHTSHHTGGRIGVSSGSPTAVMPDCLSCHVSTIGIRWGVSRPSQRPVETETHEDPVAQNRSKIAMCENHSRTTESGQAQPGSLASNMWPGEKTYRVRYLHRALLSHCDLWQQPQNRRALFENYRQF